MAREILIKRRADRRGWRDATGRIEALRVIETLEPGMAALGWNGYRGWEVRLLDLAGTVLDAEMAETLTEAEERAWWFRNRIEEGRA